MDQIPKYKSKHCNTFDEITGVNLPDLGLGHGF